MDNSTITVPPSKTAAGSGKQISPVLSFLIIFRFSCVSQVSANAHGSARADYSGQTTSSARGIIPSVSAAAS